MSLIEQNDKKTIMIAGGIFIITAFFIFYVVLLKPMSKKITKKQKELEALQIQLREAQTIAQSLDKLEKEYRILEYELKESAARLPQEKEIADLLRQITNLSKKTKVNFGYFRLQGMVSKDFYKEVPINVGVSCTYNNLGIFLSELGSLPRIVNVSNVQIQPLGNDTKGTISATFLITTFTFAEGGGV